MSAGPSPGAGPVRLLSGATEITLCEVGGDGTFMLPLFGDSEQTWPKELRSMLYFLGLIWCFLGVAIIADTFMASIERITSAKVRKFNPTQGRWYTTTVWNATVANLTLMALGSSAPEIMLNVVETCLLNKMFSGKLGPSTIIGSASFNLLIIIAVCVLAIPSGELRRIKEINVYYVTSAFSIFAYLWMVFVLLAVSPHVIEPWEGVLTLLFFPLMVWIAYLADRGYFDSNHQSDDPMRIVIKDAPGATGEQGCFSIRVSNDMSKEELAELQAQVRREHGMDLSDDQVARIIAVRNTDTSSRAHYRASATRMLTGAKRVPMGRRASLAIWRNPLSNKVVPTSVGAPSRSEEMSGAHSSAPCTLNFSTGSVAVLENAGFVRLKVLREGDLSGAVRVKYLTRDGSAKASGRQSKEEGGGDYIHVEGCLTFDEGEKEKIIEIQILDDNTYEEDEEFYVDLFEPEMVNGSDCKLEQQQVALGRIPSATVVIIDDDYPGTIVWEKEEESVQEQLEDCVACFKVLRKNGCRNTITLMYHTENDSALAGKDYESCEGTITMENGVTSAFVKVNILARGRYGTTETFRVVLDQIDTVSGAKFDETTDGGPNSCILTVTIEPGQEDMERVDRMMSQLVRTWDKSKIGHNSWKDQFVSAMYVNGGEDDGDKPSAADWVMHVLSFPWKFLFAFCPPTDFCGGWACFLCSLLMIGGMTIIIGDLANLFGCVLPFMENEITAITLVALGTSMPDTFASKSAAVSDPDADASVGNVTGSNSVNVFLGLGLPWMFASIFWWVRNDDAEWDAKYQNDADLDWLGPMGNRRKAYVVKAGDLGFSVGVFTSCAIVCLSILALRRRYLGGELGGPKLFQYLTGGVLVFLWFMYILLSTLKIKKAL